ncbi:hypothetical protein KBF61_02225 [Candidatus Saccharibacteria bacterium]|nr:hypothetical protein [Candidatus Saccharibacteria bacterium]
MLPEYFAYVGSGLFLFGTIFYIYKMLVGQAKPNKVTWGLWAFASGVGFAAAYSAGGGIQTLAPFASSFFPLLVFVLSFFVEQSYWKTKPLDYLVAVIVVLAILLWAIIDQPIVALVLAIIADALAYVPTFIKIKQEPSTEPAVTYLFAVAGPVIVLLTINSWEVSRYLFPLYLTLINLLTVSFITVGNRQQKATR